MKLDDKLYLIRYNTDNRSHIRIVNQDICAKECEDRACTRICPAQIGRASCRERV